MQLLFQESEESPGAKGLALLPGTVKKFRGELPVPHIGWNDAVPVRPSLLFGEHGGCFYFVHSFYAEPGPSAIATTTYGVTFASAVQAGNVLGVQFHPEKSQNDGLVLLKKFCGDQ
jgi:imidazole glycerol phosphate synthase glutamine amidotransferase subunit